MTNDAVTIADLTADYAEGRDDESLQRLRLAVLRHPGYDAGLDVLGSTADLRARNDHAGVVSAVSDRMPGAFFSPSAHFLLSTAHEQLGDMTRAARERRTARLAMESILATGDGSAERPWSVLRISDEYDVLRVRGLTTRRQTKVTRSGRAFDVHRLDDGAEVWFDIDLFFGGER